MATVTRSPVRAGVEGVDAAVVARQARSRAVRSRTGAPLFGEARMVWLLSVDVRGAVPRWADTTAREITNLDHDVGILASAEPSSRAACVRLPTLIGSRTRRFIQRGYIRLFDPLSGARRGKL